MKIPKIIFEDDDLLVVDKPSGMVVNRSQTTRHFKTLEDWLDEKEISRGVERNGIVHRLDKETSGVLVVAKNRQAMDKLQAQFKNRETIKKYITLVHGELITREGRVRAPIGRNPFNRMRFGVLVGGKGAETNYKLIARYQDKAGKLKFSLVEVRPKTGRTHQIRVHMKYLGFPVVADELYAGRKTAKKDRFWCPRVFLHAQSLVIKHPKTNQKQEFKAELSDDLRQVLNKLKKVDV